MQTQKSSPVRSLLRKRLLWVIIIMLTVCGVLAFVLLTQMNDKDKAGSLRPPNTVDYGPPTEEEKKAAEEFKQKQQQESAGPPISPPTPAPDGRKSVTPTISYIGQYDASIEASAFISTVFEDGGTCTLTLKKGSATVTRTAESVKDARSTRCSLITFPSKELEKGTWVATITYDSPTATGVSEVASLEVK